MGLNGWIHWASWFTRSLVFLIIADFLISVCYIVKVPLKSGGSSSVIGESDITLVFFFLFSYSFSLFFGVQKKSIFMLMLSVESIHYLFLGHYIPEAPRPEKGVRLECW